MTSDLCKMKFSHPYYNALLNSDRYMIKINLMYSCRTGAGTEQQNNTRYKLLEKVQILMKSETVVTLDLSEDELKFESEQDPESCNKPL